MATVFRAQDERHGRPVAVKVLHPELGEALGAERFLREVQITARLAHPHILPLLDSGEADGLLYYVMPFVEGESLRERLDREGELSIAEATRLAREVADALAYAHSYGVVHRDIKPENILLVGGHAVVSDFGIARAIGDDTDARLTGTGLAIGTPVYMSPEQSQGAGSLDGRTDIYSLGCTLYEMLTGEPPFTGPNPMAVTARKLTEPVPPVRARRETVTASLEAALTQALARSPADRFRTAGEFAAALAAPGPSGERATQTPRLVALAAVVLVAAAAVLALAGRDAHRGGETAPAPSAVAVLPFENLSSDTAQAYLADGLTDEIITSLSMVEGLRVASRTSSTILARQGLDLAALASRLSVNAVLEGSVRASAGRVRVSARLVQAADGYPIWSQTFDRTTDDVLRIQEEIATAIVAALRGRLAPGQVADAAGASVPPEAYDLYLQGRAVRRRESAELYARQVAYFREAIALAPHFARAWDALAAALVGQGWHEYRDPRDVFPEAAKAAAEALRLEPRNASAQATVAYVALYFEWDLAKAEREFRRALEMDPGDAAVHQWYGNHLTIAQRFPEADEAFRTALRLDPASPTRRAVQVWAQYHRGDLDEALRTYRRITEVDSTSALAFQWGALALEAAGQTEEAVRAARVGVRLADDGTSFLATLGHALAVHGERQEARAVLERLKRAPFVIAYDVAKLHLALGERDEALRWLERAYELRSHSMMFLRIDPQLRTLHGDPRFEALVRRVGI